MPGGVGTGPTSRRVRFRWRRITDAVSWTPPTSTEIGVVAKSGLAAGLAWWIADLATDVAAPVLASLTAIVVVQVSVRASVRKALQRSAAVVLGVLLALAIGDLLGLNAITVALLVAVSLGVAELLLRLPSSAARQVPVSALVVLSAVVLTPEVSAWQRALDTVIGAAVGVAVSMALPASRFVDARQTLERLATSLRDVLHAMGSGLEQDWSTAETEEWRRHADTTRDRLLRQAVEAVGDSREAAHWNVRDRRHVAALTTYEALMPRWERTAIGVSVIARGLDDHARLAGTVHAAMPAMGALLVAIGDAAHVAIDDVLGGATDDRLAASLAEVQARRQRCVRGASRRARLALEQEGVAPVDQLEGEWLGYAALLVQVDRIISDLRPPPAEAP